MAVLTNNYWYDPYTDRQMSRDQFTQAMRQLNANSYDQALNGQLPGQQSAAAKPIPQPEPYMNPVLLLLE